MFFASKQKGIESEIARYCDTVLDCVRMFKRAIEQHCENPDRGLVKKHYDTVHKAESLADDIRREIEVMMYTKALFPESRGDILGLLETMDKVPNHAESAVRVIYEEHLTVPQFLVPGITRLLDVSERCVEAMLDAVDKLFKDYTSATVAVGKVDELETEADRIESELKERVFASDMEGLDKILLRDLIGRFSGICDRAENVGDRVRIMVAKRAV